MCYNAAYYEQKYKKLEDRYANLTYDKSEWAEKKAFNVSGFAHPYIPTLSFDKPTDVVPRIWGFHPSYFKTPQDAYKVGGGLINARDDELIKKIKENKKFYIHKGMINRPVVILFNGFIEWHTLTSPKLKVPYYHYSKDGEMFAIAGISTEFEFVGRPGQTHEGVTLVTTTGNGLVSHIHNIPHNSRDLRMPAILAPEEISKWLDTSLDPLERLDMLGPYPSQEMMAHSIPNFLTKANKARFFNTEDGLKPFDFGRDDAPMHIDGADYMDAA